MPFLPLEIEPGIFRNGTKYQSKGRWFDANLVRWIEGAMQPIGGWVPMLEGGSAVDLGEPVWGMHGWQANDGGAHVAVGTKDQAYVISEGTQTEITPTGFTAGDDTASITDDAYGDGAYGAGVYGEGDTTQVTTAKVQAWHFDNFGEQLIAVATSDGVMYSWDTNEANDLETVTDAPTQNNAVVVTPERFVVALGADGDPRKVQWADQESLTTWSPASTNQAGDFILPGGGEIVAGRRGRGETLIWTNEDLWAMRYIAGTLIYSFEQVGASVGPIGSRAMVMVDNSRAFWMGPERFFVYDGAARPIPSDVRDHVFGDMNKLQASKIHAVANSDDKEVWWFYPSAGSSEIDRYVIYNYAEGQWSIGELNRTAGMESGAFDFPIMADRTGAVWQHERSTKYEDVDGSDLTPFAESGPVEIGNGDRIMIVRQLVPDEETLGDVEAKLFTAPYPTADETEHGPFTLSEPTSVRASGRQVRLRVDQVNPDWRVGTMRLEVTPGERR